MSSLIKILYLKLKLHSLKRKRDNAIISIIENQREHLNRVDCMEDVNPKFFNDINKEISTTNRLIKINKKRWCPKSHIKSVAAIFLF